MRLRGTVLINPIFDLLESFDVIARNLPFETKTDFSLEEKTVKTLAMSEINTGVIFFSDSDEAGEILDAWHTNFIEIGVSRDQPAFLRALLISKKARFLPLPPMWNATPFKKVDLAQMKADPNKIKILHYRDPVFWPSIAPKLARIHGGAEFSLIAPDLSFEKARQQYEPLARLYSSWLFQYLLGRYALNIISRYLLRGRGRLKKIDSRREPEKGSEL